LLTQEPDPSGLKYNGVSLTPKSLVQVVQTAGFVGVQVPQLEVEAHGEQLKLVFS